MRGPTEEQGAGGCYDGGDIPHRLRGGGARA
jgi:hypothetical protein